MNRTAAGIRTDHAAEAISLGIHESQSRMGKHDRQKSALLETLCALSGTVRRRWIPSVRNGFIVHSIRLSPFIRVEADECTYNCILFCALKLNWH